MDVRQAVFHETSLPTVGFTVWWSLAGIRVTHADLQQALDAAGFGAFLPSPPTYRKALRRALQAWIRQRTFQVEVEDDDDDEEGGSAAINGRKRRSGTLIRTINQPRARFMVFALVAEDQDLAALGLSYATAIRILLDKEQGGMIVTTERKGASILERAGEMAAGVTLQPAEAEARQIAHELLPHWRRYRDLHVSGDLSRMVKDIVCGETIKRPQRGGSAASAQERSGLDAISVRPGGGLYFVPEAQAEGLHRLREMIESLPTDGSREPYFVAQPVIDDAAAKAHLARAAHQGFLDEIGMLEADLERVMESANPSQRTLTSRLTTYREVAAKVGTYSDLLEMQREDVERRLGKLRRQVTKLVMDDEDEDELPQQAELAVA